MALPLGPEDQEIVKGAKPSDWLKMFNTNPNQ
jgi:hypothetical protein